MSSSNDNPMSDPDNFIDSVAYEITAVSIGCLAVMTNVAVMMLICARKRLHNSSNLILCSKFFAGALFGGLYVIPTFGFPQIQTFFPFCIILPLLAQSMSININYHISLISYDRYCHVIYPLHSPLTPVKKSLSILLIWIASLAAPAIVTMSVVPPGNMTACDVNFQLDTGSQLLLKSFSALLFFIPLGVTIIFYVRILIVIWSRKRSISALVSNRPLILRAKRKTRAITHILMIIGIFSFCWSPYIISSFINGWLNEDVFYYVYGISILLIFIYATVNPLVYLFNTQSLRIEMVEVICIFKSKFLNHNHNSWQETSFHSTAPVAARTWSLWSTTV
ncbi:uncharacterized protein TRIADDRAFT_57727 [Trichoplax adhaerens]|uniref:G-protein coupled receptors family 1 profile domain-containing protein n=1 Tax=Trichoplax adhaerens TaxID=10228 RepID=B3S089_TRIAD|nr:hypothetical protein TRIADDRAFT_57727 [Trichoplax adhaerens]EDV24345.1 hypothetical protein TRIADDRAFT_57727 [Trichoplax adhaerens]|eukprot:XP_002113871.1 hypothetical protein TRIADDRAFT_57727 [Trichoplax adhaerens]